MAELCEHISHYHGSFDIFKDPIPRIIRTFQEKTFSNPESYEKLTEELNLQASISGPFIAPYKAIEVLPGVTRIQRIKVEGVSLYDFGRLNGPSPDLKLVKIAFCIAQAMNYLHNNGIIIQNLKPENIIINEDEMAFLVDFGISAITEDTIVMNNSIETLLLYGPEGLMQSQFKPGPQLDVYQFGIILYLMACGNIPWNVKNVSRVFGQMINGTIEVPPEISPGISKLIKICLTPDPYKRPTPQMITNYLFNIINNTQRPPKPTKLPVAPIPGFKKVICRHNRSLSSRAPENSLLKDAAQQTLRAQSFPMRVRMASP